MIAVGLVLFVLSWLIVVVRNTLISDGIDDLCGLAWLVGLLLMLFGAVRWLWLVAP